MVVGVHGPYPGKVQQRVEKHRRVAGGEDESVAVRPNRIPGIVAQKPLPQAVGDRRQPHGRAGVAGVRRLNGIHGKGPDGVDGEEIQVLLVGHPNLRWRPVPADFRASRQTNGAP